MTAIPSTFGSGGSGLTPNKSSGSPSLAETLRDIARDLIDLKGAAPAATLSAALSANISANITTGTLPAFTDPPSAAEMAALRTLVNENRALLIEMRAVIIELRALAVQIRAAEVEDRATQTTRSGVTLRTTLG